MIHSNESTAKQLNAAYQDLLGVVPDMLEQRQRLAQITQRESAIDAIENFRNELIHHNPLERHTQQLVHFAMLIACGERAAARLHAAAALKAGATLADLQGVAETAAVVCGMPKFGLVIELISGLDSTITKP